MSALQPISNKTGHSASGPAPDVRIDQRERQQLGRKRIGSFWAIKGESRSSVNDHIQMAGRGPHLLSE